MKEVTYWRRADGFIAHRLWGATGLYKIDENDDVYYLRPTGWAVCFAIANEIRIEMKQVSKEDVMLEML